MAKRHLTSEIVSVSPALLRSMSLRRAAAAGVEDSNNSTNCSNKTTARSLSMLSPVTLKRPMAMILPRLCLTTISDSGLEGTDCASVPEGQGRSPAPATVDVNHQMRLKCSQSMPCISSSTAIAPTAILPFLYLGSHHDALSETFFKEQGITHVLNVSTACLKTGLVSDVNFLRIPVNDSHTDRLLPFFQQAFHFLDEVQKSNGCVLVHCLAGISRSPTLVIAYLMHHLNKTMDEAYRFVKDKRPGISPNFNFLGQLMEFETQRRKPVPSEVEEPTAETQVKRTCYAEVRIPAISQTECQKKRCNSNKYDQSPTTGLAKLHFNVPSPTADVANTQKYLSTSTSLHVSREDVLCKSSFQASRVSHQVAAQECRPDVVDIASFSTHRACDVRPIASNETVPQLSDISLRPPKNFTPRQRPTSIAITGCQFLTPMSCGLREKSPISPLTSGVITSPPRTPELTTIHESRFDDNETRKEIKSAMAESADLCWHSEQAFKSRSLEDILVLAEDPSCFKRLDVLSSSFPVDSAGLSRHCQRDTNQSSSSISSIGSHAGSIHSSLEVMQVF